MAYSASYTKLPPPEPKVGLGAKLLLLSAIDLAILLTMRPTKRVRHKKQADRPIPDLASAPTRKGRKYVEQYLKEAEAAARIPGLTTFGVAASYREARWNNKAVNPKDGPGACKGYRRNAGDHFKHNPYPEPMWCFGSGGWFGQLPSTAASSDPIFYDDTPYMIFDPAKSTTAFAAKTRSLVRKYWDDLPPEHRNWLSVRRAMRSLEAFWDYDESDTAHTGSAGVRERLASDLEATGTDPNFMYQTVELGPYPGTKAVYDRLRKLN